MDKTKAVKDYIKVDGKLSARWFPMVPGFPGEFVIPQAWVDANCPEGFTNPLAAHAAAREFLGIDGDGYVL